MGLPPHRVSRLRRRGLWQAPIYTAEAFPHIRVECCDRCQIYIKSIDLTKNGLAEPLVDELSSLPLDLRAQEHGYSKLYPNLLGM